MLKVDKRYKKHLLKMVNFTSPEYDDLTTYLMATEYVYHNSSDKNRAEDGLYLRNYYNASLNLEEKCSVLEMLVAFAIRLTDEYLDNSYYEYEFLFTTFLGNLGLLEYTNDYFQKNDPYYIIDMWLNCEKYGQNVKNIFPKIHTFVKKNNTDLWSQAMEYCYNAEKNGILW